MKTHMKIFTVLMTVFTLGMAAQAADLIIGNWQNNTGDGWTDSSDVSITNAANMPAKYQFETSVVTGYSQSLGVHETGFGNARLKINLTSIPGGLAAFTNGTKMQFTFSCPPDGGAAAGYMQLVQFQYNSPGSGFQNISSSWTGNGFSATGDTGNNSGDQPIFYFYASSPARSQVVTWDYSSVKASILSAGVTYLQITFVFQTGGGAPTNVLMNNVKVLDPNPVPGLVIGSWQNNTGDGWTDNSDVSITNVANAPFYLFESGVVAGYAQSLGIQEAGFGTHKLKINLNSIGALTAFTNGHRLQFTFSCPPDTGAGSGYMKVAQVQYNSPGSGQVTAADQGPDNFTANGFTSTGSTGNNSGGGTPNFYFYASAPARSQVVTWDYSSIKSSIMSGSLSYVQLIFVFQVGGGAPTNVLLNNVVLLTDTNPPTPPTLAIQKATRGLRIFAGSTANTYDRAELATTDSGQSWVGGSYPVSYSFSLLSYPANINQTHIVIVPVNTSGQANMGNAGSANEYIDYQSTNMLWLNISNAVSGVVARVEWKTNLPNANPNHTAVAVANSTAVGTWTLTFNSASTGTLTAPGASPVAFTITDPNVSTDFANPAVAYFGLQPNSTTGIGQYEDWGFISVSGVTGTQENENFSTESSFNPNSYWANNSGPNASPAPCLQFVPASSAYWINWTLPATSFGLGTAMSITGNTNTSGYPWVLPEYYNNYNDGLNLPSSIQGSKTWVQAPTNCLPTSDGTVGGPLAPDAFFRLFNPPLSN